MLSEYGILPCSFRFNMSLSIASVKLAYTKLSPQAKPCHPSGERPVRGGVGALHTWRFLQVLIQPDGVWGIHPPDQWGDVQSYKLYWGYLCRVSPVTDSAGRGI